MNIFTRFINTIQKEDMDNEGNYETLFSAVVASLYPENEEVQNSVSYAHDTDYASQAIYEVLDYWKAIRRKYPQLGDIDVRVDLINPDTYGTLYTLYFRSHSTLSASKSEFVRALEKAIDLAGIFTKENEDSGASTLAALYQNFRQMLSRTLCRLSDTNYTQAVQRIGGAV